MNALLVAAAYVFTPVLFFRGLKMRSRCTYSVLRQASLAALVPESNGRGSMLRVLTPRVLQILAVVSIMFAAPIRAESGAWSSHGPFGGRVNGFAFAVDDFWYTLAQTPVMINTCEPHVFIGEKA